MFILPRVRKWPPLEQGLPPESIVVCHQLGWMLFFSFPEVSDISEIFPSDIKGRLKTNILKHGKIQELQLLFFC